MLSALERSSGASSFAKFTDSNSSNPEDLMYVRKGSYFLSALTESSKEHRQGDTPWYPKLQLRASNARRGNIIRINHTPEGHKATFGL